MILILSFSTTLTLGTLKELLLLPRKPHRKLNIILLSLAIIYSKMLRDVSILSGRPKDSLKQLSLLELIAPQGSLNVRATGETGLNRLKGPKVLHLKVTLNQSRMKFL